MVASILEALTLSPFVEGNTRLALWGFAIAVEVGVALLKSSRRRRAAIPIHMSHLVERFGLFTIIVLGETVLAVVIGVAHAHWVASAVIFAAVGLTMSFSPWWIYFEAVTGTPLQNIGGLRPIVWVYAHAPLVIGITALGVGIEVAVFTELGERLEAADTVILVGSLAIALLAIGFVLAAETTPELRVRMLLERLPAVLLALAVGLLPVAAQTLLVGLAVIAAGQAVVDVRANRRDTLPPSS